MKILVYSDLFCLLDGFLSCPQMKINWQSWKFPSILKLWRVCQIDTWKVCIKHWHVKSMYLIFYHSYCKDQRKLSHDHYSMINQTVKMGYEKWYTYLLFALWAKICGFEIQNYVSYMYISCPWSGVNHVYFTLAF